MTDQMISADEVARRLGMSVETVYRYVRDDRIPYYRVGPILRFDWDEVLGALKGTAA